VSELRLSLPEEALDLIADRLADRLAARLAAPAPSPWLTAEEAAQHLRCDVLRVRKLTSLGDLPVHRDGRRVLYRRAELDAFVARGGASTGR
jgi:excisionase family DNA binding protein